MNVSFLTKSEKISISGGMELEPLAKNSQVKKNEMKNGSGHSKLLITFLNELRTDPYKSLVALEFIWVY